MIIYEELGELCRLLQARRSPLGLIIRRISNSRGLKIFQPETEVAVSDETIEEIRGANWPENQDLVFFFFFPPRISSAHVAAGLWRSVEQTAWPQRFRWSQYFWAPGDSLHTSARKADRDIKGKLQKKCNRETYTMWPAHSGRFSTAKE